MNPKYLVFNTYNMKFSVHSILPNSEILSLDISQEEAMRLKNSLGIREQGKSGQRTLLEKGTEPHTHEIYWNIGKPHADFWEKTETVQSLKIRNIDYSKWSDRALINWTIDIGAQLTELPDPESDPKPETYQFM
jgi:hypothetical protein